MQPFGRNGPGQCHAHRAGLHAQFGTHAAQLQYRFAAVVACQGVGGFRQGLIQPARQWDALVAVPRSSAVLYRRAKAGL